MTTTESELPKVVLIRSETIMQAPPFPESHASTVVSLSRNNLGNKLLVAWFGGSRESNPDVVIWASTQENGHWSTPRQIADGIINDSLRYPCWNPVLFKTRAGKLFLFYKVGQNPRTWWGMMKFSMDDGETWSAPQKLPDSFLGPIRNKPVQLRNGDLLHPSSTESEDEKTWHIHLEKSDQDGQQWQKIAIDNGTFGAIQPTILRYSRRKLQLLNRSRQNSIVQSWSYDNGKTWSALSATHLPNPNSGVDAVSLRNGWQMLVYNPLRAGANWADGRAKLRIAMSKEGTDWHDVYTLEDHATGEFSYPAIVQSADGLVHITYTLNRKNIQYVSLRISD